MAVENLKCVGGPFLPQAALSQTEETVLPCLIESPNLNDLLLLSLAL